MDLLKYINELMESRLNKVRVSSSCSRDERNCLEENLSESNPIYVDSTPQVFD